MDGNLGWLAEGSTNPIPPQYRDWEKNDFEHPARTAAAGKSPTRKPDERKSAA
jgi:hypothetical protein